MEEIESKSPIVAEPDNKPDAESKLAQAGKPSILKIKLSPSASFAEGVKFRASPTLVVEVLPAMVGAEFCIIMTGALLLPPPPQELTINKNMKHKALSSIILG
jgi:hypothetical protein